MGRGFAFAYFECAFFLPLTLGCGWYIFLTLRGVRLFREVMKRCCTPKGGPIFFCLFPCKFLSFEGGVIFGRFFSRVWGRILFGRGLSKCTEPFSGRFFLPFSLPPADFFWTQVVRSLGFGPLLWFGVLFGSSFCGLPSAAARPAAGSNPFGPKTTAPSSFGGAQGSPIRVPEALLCFEKTTFLKKRNSGYFFKLFNFLLV